MCGCGQETRFTSTRFILISKMSVSRFTIISSSPKVSLIHVCLLKEYTELDESTKLIGIWDDHDYGISDGDGSFKHKEWFREKYLDFLDEPTDSKRRTRNGIYESYYLDKEGRVKIIMLDIHFARKG